MIGSSLIICMLENVTESFNNEPHFLYEGQILLMDANTVHKIEPLGENDILINLIIPKYYLTANFFNRFSSDSVLTSFLLKPSLIE